MAKVPATPDDTMRRVPANGTGQTVPPLTRVVTAACPPLRDYVLTGERVDHGERAIPFSNTTTSTLTKENNTIRPTSGFRLEPRDRAILASLARFRFLTAEHIRWLFFRGRTLRACQARVKRLLSAGLIEKTLLALRLTALTQERSGPVYAVSRAGAEIAREDTGTLPIHGFPWKGVGPAALLHHLVAVDVLVSLTVALQGHPGVGVEALPELVFRQAIATRSLARSLPRQVLVPDGGATIATPAGERLSYYLEVVRSDVKGGTGYLIRKLKRYVELHRAGILTDLFGTERLRAVILLTSSPGRAEFLRQRADELVHGRQLFWFGSYSERREGRIVRTLRPDTILTPRFRTLDGAAVSLLPPESFPQSLTHAPPPPFASAAILSRPPAHPRGDHVAQSVPPVRLVSG